uniref:Ral guanine nucleotide dissociation stimulator like 3 n=1 Tax=Myotis myotis TaxID=51298 RepID=A0A7J7XJP4_MYOMY|nr:ral guanine nucleotide dissociation stimulator like 3 [Myotis myotis]
MLRTAGKELALAPLQDWGEETEDGAVYSVSLRRQRSQRLSPREGPGDGQTPGPHASTFLHYRTSKVRMLRAAHLERLVRELVSVDREQDPGFVPAFLATHQAFVPTARVLGLLLPPPPPPLPPWVEIKKTEGQDLSFNKNLRAVVSVLGSWLRDHPQDFWDPPAHSDLGRVRTFLGWAAPLGAEALEAEKLLRDFLEEAEQEQDEEEQPQASAGPPGTARTPSPDSPEGYLEEEEGLVQEGPELLDFSVDQVAEQLTLMDVELFSRVRPCECLGSVWSQRDRPGAAGIAPTVRATVTQFNLVTGCVLGSVLGAPGLAAPQRAQRLEKWIRIAQRCRELRNFSSLRAILSALQSNPIYRLKSSWGAVSREPLSTFRKLSQIFSDENNHLSSREILSQGSPGDPSSPTSSLSPGSPPSSPRMRDPPPGSPPASPGPQGSSTKLPLALTLSCPGIPHVGQQGSEARVIRVSIDNDHGNLYRSILLTSQDKVPSVVQRALQKHNVAQFWARDYQLFQVLPGEKELLIPDNANVFYAMSPAAPGDFMLRRRKKEEAQHTTSVSPT